MLGTLKPDQKARWAVHLGAVAHAYNCTKHESMGYSPFYLVFLRKPKLPIDLLIPLPPADKATLMHNLEYPYYIQCLKQHMQQVYGDVQMSAERARNKQKGTYDQKVNDCFLQLGDTVLAANKSQRGKAKLWDRWETTPYMVVRNQ